MNKAEEKAMEKYPLIADDDKEGLEALKYIGMECDCASEYNEVQEAKQAYFIEGYHQAEKDLELTCEDVLSLKMLLDEVENEFKKGQHEDKDFIGYCTEVLKRFKERKEVKGKG